MSYSVQISSRAKRELRGIDRKDQVTIAAGIDRLAADPRPEDSKKLSGASDLYRVRASNYRVVYRIADEALVVLVVRIGHRREVYRRLGEL